MIKLHDTLRAKTETDDWGLEKSRIVDVGVDALAGLVLVDDKLIEVNWLKKSKRLINELFNLVLYLKRPFRNQRCRSQNIFPVIHVLKPIVLGSSFQ